MSLPRTAMSSSEAMTWPCAARTRVALGPMLGGDAELDAVPVDAHQSSSHDECVIARTGFPFSRSHQRPFASRN